MLYLYKNNKTFGLYILLYLDTLFISIIIIIHIVAPNLTILKILITVCVTVFTNITTFYLFTFTDYIFINDVMVIFIITTVIQLSSDMCNVSFTLSSP